jgi:hypothetical protein
MGERGRRWKGGSLGGGFGRVGEGMEVEVRIARRTSGVEMLEGGDSA